jgi:hypothetical protein
METKKGGFRKRSDKLLAEERKKKNNNNKWSKHNMSPKLCLGDIIKTWLQCNVRISLKKLTLVTVFIFFTEILMLHCS